MFTTPSFPAESNHLPSLNLYFECLDARTERTVREGYFQFLYFEGQDVVLRNMLQSFRVKVDSGGIRSIHFEKEVDGYPAHSEGCAEFWVVIQDDLIPGIYKALHSGQNYHALEILCEQSHSFGRIVSVCR